MSAPGEAPDAWDDDWTNVADKPATKSAQPDLAPKLSKSDRRRLHIQQQRELWDSAENPSRNLFLEAQGVVPLKQEPKQPMTVLSRKPPTIAKKGLTDQAGKLTLDDEDDSEEEARKKREADFEERQRKAKLDREEKQRRYAEARERIMGSSNPSTAPGSRDSSNPRDHRRQRGNKANGNRRSQPDTPADQSPARQSLSVNDKQLFDPDDMSRRLQKRETLTFASEGQPSRQPRGPDNSGRGGFSFSNRGGMLGA